MAKDDKNLALNPAMAAKLIAKTENGRGAEYLDMLQSQHDSGSCRCANCS